MTKPLYRFCLAMIATTLACSSEEPSPVSPPDASTDADVGQQDVAPDAAPDATQPDVSAPDAQPDVQPLPDPIDAPTRGEFAVGNQTVTLQDGARGRTLDVEIWYPATSGGSEPATGFEQDPNLMVLDGLLQAANTCPTQQTSSARDAMPISGTYPVLAFSHCHACTRYSSFTVAEHLASWGYVVVAADHEDNTLFDELAGTGVALSTDFLQVRAADVRALLDAVLDGDLLPDGVTADPSRVGVYGHSFGSVTTGLVAQQDPRIAAAFGIAAPMENPLLAGVTVADITVPLGFLVAREDNSIREIGNRLIRDNFAAATQAAWKIEVADAGHWSVSDLVGLVEMFDPGCGSDTRQVGGEPFDYIDPALGRTITAAYVLAFFEATLNANRAGTSFLAAPPPWAQVDVESNAP